MKKVQLLPAGHFFFIDFPKLVEIQVLRSPVYRGTAHSSASIAWSSSKLTSWFERSGNLDGDSVSPCPRMPSTDRVVGGKCAVLKADKYDFRLVMSYITAGFHPGRFV